MLLKRATAMTLNAYVATVAAYLKHIRISQAEIWITLTIMWTAANRTRLVELGWASGSCAAVPSRPSTRGRARFP
jgi:hypothetical protein